MASGGGGGGSEEKEEAPSVRGSPVPWTTPPATGTTTARSRSLGDRPPERQPAFQRTFSDTPEALARFAGLARVLRGGRSGGSGGGSAGGQSAAEPDEEQTAALERGESGSGRGGGGGYGEPVGRLQELRARSLSSLTATNPDGGIGGSHGRALVFGKPGTKGEGAEGDDDDGAWPVDEKERRRLTQEFLMKLGVALHLYGSPVRRTEAVLAALAARLDVDGQFYLLPDLLLCAFGAGAAASETHIIPCPQDEDVDAYRYRKVAHLVRSLLALEGPGAGQEEQDEEEGEGEEGEEEDEEPVLDAVAEAEAGADPPRPRRRKPGRSSSILRALPQAIDKLEAIVQSPPLYSKSVQVLAHVLSAAAVAMVFWRGDLADAAIAAVSGACVALVIVPGSDNFFIAKVQILFSAILTGVVSTLGSTLHKGACAKAAYYAPITILLPGWSLAFSIMEFSMSASLLGTARMASALVVGLLLGYGIQIGHDVVVACLSEKARAGLQDWAAETTCEMQPWYVQLAAFPFIGIPYAILMHAAPIQWPAMLLSGGGAIALINGPLLDTPEHLAVFFVSFLIGAVANAHARFTASPALIQIVHAVYILVPDCMALTSAKSYIQNNLAQGWNTAVTMLLIAISIAAGLLLAQGLAVAAAASLGRWCCCFPVDGMAEVRHQQQQRRRRGGRGRGKQGREGRWWWQRRRRRGPVHAEGDTVYF